MKERELIQSLEEAAQPPHKFLALREAAKQWGAFALENLTGKHLKRALAISVALTRMADLDEQDKAR